MSSRSHLGSLPCLEQEADQMISIDPAQPLLSRDGSVFVNSWLYLLSWDIRGKVPKDSEGETVGCSLEFWEFIPALTFEGPKACHGNEASQYEGISDVLINCIFVFYLFYKCCINLLSYVTGFRSLYYLDFFPSVCQLRTMLGGEIKPTT